MFRFDRFPELFLFPTSWACFEAALAAIESSVPQTASLDGRSQGEITGSPLFAVHQFVSTLPNRLVRDSRYSDKVSG
jgi:hypothetical protein